MAPFQTMTKAEVMPTRLARDGLRTRPCPMRWIRDLSTLLASISLVVRFLAFAACAAGFRI